MAGWECGDAATPAARAATHSRVFVRRLTFVRGVVAPPCSTGLAPELPEDLYHLIKKAVAVRKHLERNRKDKDSKFRLILIESRVHRLARYYKRTRQLPPNWK